MKQVQELLLTEHAISPTSLVHQRTTAREPASEFPERQVQLQHLNDLAGFIPDVEIASHPSLKVQNPFAPLQINTVSDSPCGDAQIHSASEVSFAKSSKSCTSYSMRPTAWDLQPYLHQYIVDLSIRYEKCSFA